jgi:hypothetical protein
MHAQGTSVLPAPPSRPAWVDVSHAVSVCPDTVQVDTGLAIGALLSLSQADIGELATPAQIRDELAYLVSQYGLRAFDRAATACAHAVIDGTANSARLEWARDCAAALLNGAGPLAVAP